MQTVFEKLHDELLTVKISLIDYLNAQDKEAEMSGFSTVLSQLILGGWTASTLKRAV